MFTARKKIVKEKGAEPDEFEEQVAQVRVVDCCLLCRPAVLEILTSTRTPYVHRLFSIWRLPMPS
jgi:hypothetical protein